MKSRRLLGIIGEIEEGYVAEAYDGEGVLEEKLQEDTTPERKLREDTAQKENLQKRESKKEMVQKKTIQKKTEGGVRKWAILGTVAAACLCLVVGTIFSRRSSTEKIHGKLSDGLLSGAFFMEPPYSVINDFYIATILTTTGGRVAEYQQISPLGIQRPELPQLDTTTLRLSNSLGEFYMEENGRRWYRMKGCNNIGMLISKEENGLLRQWKYTCFLVAEEPGDRAEGFVYYVDQYPGADFSVYTFGEIFSIIYGLDSAADIESITAKVVQAGNTDTEKKIEEQVGEKTYVEREQIESFYQVVANIYCDKNVKDIRDISQKPSQYTYDFLRDKSMDGRKIYASRDLEIRLIDGTVIDGLQYDALKGYLYRRNAFSSGFLEEEVVGALNKIFGIE